jgi:FtsH-binding integral membrane protein
VPAWLTRDRAGLVGVAVGGVVLWTVGLVWFRPWVAHDDFAIFRIALERELDGHVRLVGAHSRLGVFHPGPLREWVFALPYWLSGHRSAALPATALVLNAGWVVWTSVVLSRLHPRRWALAGAVGLGLVVVALGADIASPWNPHLAVLPAYLACWSLVTVVARDGRGWVACLCSASFAAQLHASMLVVGGAVLAAALVAIAWRRPRRSAVYAWGLAVLLWSGPIVDLRKGSGANLVRLGTVGADGDPVGFGAALGHVSRLLWPGTPWHRISVRPSILEFTGFHRWWLLVVVAALVATVVAHRSRRSVEAAEVAAGAGTERVVPGSDRLPVVAGVVALAAVALAAASVSLFVEPAYRYLYGPLQAPTVFALMVAVAGAVSAAEPMLGRTVARSVSSLAGPIAAAVVAVVAAAVVAVFLSVPREDGPSAARRALGVEGAVTAALADRPAWRSVEAVPLELRGAGDLDAEVLDVALRRGVDARSRRVELGLEAPGRVDGVFAVAMAGVRDCLLAEPEADEIIRGTSDTGEPFSVVAVDRESAAYGRCVGPSID